MLGFLALVFVNERIKRQRREAAEEAQRKLAAEQREQTAMLRELREAVSGLRATATATATAAPAPAPDGAPDGGGTDSLDAIIARLEQAKRGKP